MSTVASIAECQARRAQLPDADCAALDIDLLLSRALGKPRYYLYAHPDYRLSASELAAFQSLLKRRCGGEPVAHITGRTEFWSLPLASSSATLIPRPDTECLVEWLLECFPEGTARRVLDLGTGTGAIALALASERPDWQLTAVDCVPGALALAADNARSLDLQIEVLESDWFSALTGREFDVIVGNPPYIEEDDPHLRQGDVRFEPSSALVSGADGLSAIKRIVIDAGAHLSDGGTLLLEHGYTQAAAVSALLQAAGYTGISLRRDYGGNPRATLARYVRGPIDAR